ncbi:MAG: hypothetical protein ACYCOR_11735 [Acidobacteriaceae bacterium]
MKLRVERFKPVYIQMPFNRPHWMRGSNRFHGRIPNGDSGTAKTGKAARPVWGIGGVADPQSNSVKFKMRIGSDYNRTTNIEIEIAENYCAFDMQCSIMMERARPHYGNSIVECWKGALG